MNHQEQAARELLREWGGDESDWEKIKDSTAVQFRALAIAGRDLRDGIVGALPDPLRKLFEDEAAI